MARPLGFPHTYLFFPAARTLSSIKLFSKLQAAFPPFSGKAACPFQNKRFAFWCSLVVRNVLLADSDDLNLAQQLLGQLLHGHAGTSGLAGEILAVHAVESSEVFHVSQEAGGLDDVLEAQAVSSQAVRFFRSPGKKCYPTKKSYVHLRSLGVKYHNGLQQPPGVLILGLADAADGQIFSYTALIKEQHIVTEISDRGQVVGDKYIGQPQLFLPDPAADPLPGPGYAHPGRRSPHQRG